MTEEKLAKIREVAELIRRAFAKHIVGPDSDQAGFCGQSAVQVWLECQLRGVSDICIAGNALHAFCLCEGHIIDTTVTQFGVDEEIFLKVPDVHHNDFHTISHTYSSPWEAVYRGNEWHLFSNQHMWFEDRIVVEKEKYLGEEK